jgi:hypothetical protein
MCDTLTRHQQWGTVEGLTGPDYEQQHAQVTADAAAELDRLSQLRSRDAHDAA